MAYELVANPVIQQKLHEEITEVQSQLNGKAITYEQIQRMKYLDQTISETLRKWPAAGVSSFAIK
jgi:cytochrome P450